MDRADVKFRKKHSLLNMFAKIYCILPTYIEWYAELKFQIYTAMRIQLINNSLINLVLQYIYKAENLLLPCVIRITATATSLD